MTTRKGRCLCGAVAYTVDVDPLVVRICWCRDCQRLSANGTVNMVVPTSALAVTGALASYQSRADSGNLLTREFCPTCGTHLFSQADVRPQFRVVRTGTLEDPASVKPGVNIWAASAPGWACLDPALERVEGQPLPPAAPRAS
ncbi:MAG: hypothetical protein K0Q76_3265 [Panacagrimonas sp.]|jgi:hypothetical protein|nr:GFA family protein [Panacagrimonas sp.]MCC2658157.1 hypothetical protein [Panacagrimonas sp.]